MSLNNIQLSPLVLVDLFANSLMDSNTTSVPEKHDFRYLGKNEKNILAIVNYPSIPFLPDEELAFLTNILSACKLSLADIAIVNIAGIESTTLGNVIEQGKSILLFGIDPLSVGLPINFPQFQLQQFNKRTYLYSPSLSELESDKGLKLKLWSSLKNLFGI